MDGPEDNHSDTGNDAALNDDGNPNAAEAALACNCCRRRKLRCSREVPSCQQCRKTGSECVYETKRAKPGMKAGAIENLHRRLDALERTVQQQSVRAERERGSSASHGTPGGEPAGAAGGAGNGATLQQLPPDGGANNSPYGILSFFARELQRFNESATSGHQNRDRNRGRSSSPDHHHHPAKRRRVASPPAQLTLGVPSLPDGDALEAVLRAYFHNVHPWIPLLHEGRLRRRLLHAPDRRCLRVVLQAMVLAATRFVEDVEIATTWAPQHHEQQMRARDWIVAEAMRDLSVESLQALVIVAFDDIGGGQAALAWSIIGSLTRTVEYLQLTVEDGETDRPSLVQPWVSLPPPQDWTEAEERRRVFWNVFNLDRFCSVAMGWNTSLTSDDVNRRLPCDGITWRKEDPVDTPYFGIWDKAAGRIGNPIAFLPSHYPAPPQTGHGLGGRDDDRQPSQHQHPPPQHLHHQHHHHHHPTPSEPGVSPSAGGGGGGSGQSGVIDMSSVGAFAYSIEATESLSRVNTYFLQQRVDMRDNRDLSSWLTRFKELDLRLVHWKMFLPQKWKATVARQRGARMDPNLTLAHVTHNASMILLHQVMAFPSPAWTFKNRLPSLLSVDTCQAAAVEIAAMTQNYLESAPPAVPVTSQFAFCIYVAAKVLLLHWRYAAVQTLTPEFWILVRSLDDMARRWCGPHGLDAGRPCLAAKYAARLTRFHARCVGDEAYRISVLGYTTEIDHSPGAGVESPTDAEGAAAQHQQRPLPPGVVPQRQQQQQQTGAMTPSNLGPGLPLPLPLGFTAGPGAAPGLPGLPRTGAFPHRGSTGSGELGAISQVFMDQQFMDMDRVISYDDGVFGTEYEGGW